MPRSITKYQVFVSSTFSDLRRERERVVWEVLRLFHIPAGMETFPAADDRGWAIIRRVIDDSDFYVLIVGGRYGSVDPETGVSWTEREYEYARSRKIEILAFVRRPSSVTEDLLETDATLASRRREFVERVRSRHLVVEWSSQEELAAEVSRALSTSIRIGESGESSPAGWVRGDAVPSPSAIDEIATLSRRNRDLEAEVRQAATSTSKELFFEFGEQGIGPDRAARVTPFRWAFPGDSAQFSVPSGSYGVQKTQVMDYLWARWNTIWLAPEVVSRDSGFRSLRGLMVDVIVRGCTEVLFDAAASPFEAGGPARIAAARAAAEDHTRMRHQRTLNTGGG